MNCNYTLPYFYRTATQEKVSKSSESGGQPSPGYLSAIAHRRRLMADRRAAGGRAKGFSAAAPQIGYNFVQQAPPPYLVSSNTMYKPHPPKPLIVKLIDEHGFQLRQKAAKYITANQNRTGAERGSSEEQGFGALAEMVIRNSLGMPEVNPADHPLGYDILLPSGIKLDVKCRGGSLPFKEEYESDDGIVREAKHNFFARQIHDENLGTDIYLMTHLETPAKRELPGTTRQRKWILYICGWVSKERVMREGVYLPRGSLTEQGRTWFTYRGQEIEFYNRNLNGLAKIEDLSGIETIDVAQDKLRKGDLNLTSVDAIRIAYDLIGRGILSEKHLAFVQKKTSLYKTVKPILHANQYFHLLHWLQEKGVLTDDEMENARRVLQEEQFSGI